VVHSSLSYDKTVHLWVSTGLFILLAAVVIGAILASNSRINYRRHRMRRKLETRGWDQQRITAAINRKNSSKFFSQPSERPTTLQTPKWEMFVRDIGIYAIIPLIALAALSAITLEIKYPIHKTVKISYIDEPIPLKSCLSNLNPVLVANRAQFNCDLTSTVKLYVAFAYRDGSGTEFLDQKVNYTKGFVVAIFANDIWTHEPNPVRACDHMTIYVTGNISQFNGYYEILNPTSIKILKN